jgi:hypothetical protein
MSPITNYHKLRIILDGESASTPGIALLVEPSDTALAARYTSINSRPDADVSHAAVYRQRDLAFRDNASQCPDDTREQILAAIDASKPLRRPREDQKGRRRSRASARSTRPRCARWFVLEANRGLDHACAVLRDHRAVENA